jgi:5-methylcytosine-specific restriction endonuclease McrA
MNPVQAPTVGVDGVANAVNILKICTDKQTGRMNESRDRHMGHPTTNALSKGATSVVVR